ncbi:uncharacterized protein LOC144436184 [Glandiceps talaboti]
MAEQKYAPSEPAPPYQSQDYQMAQQPYPQAQPQYPPQQYPPQATQQYPPQATQQYPTQTTSNVTVVTGQTAPSTVVITRSRSTSPTGLDVAGLAMGIWHLLCCFFPLGLASVIISSVAMVYRCDGRSEMADKLSKASVIISIIAFVLGLITIIIVVVYVVVVVNAATTYDYDGY